MYYYFFLGNPVKQHPAVPIEEVLWLNRCVEEDGVPFDSAVRNLRRKLFPFMYDPKPWVEGNVTYITFVCTVFFVFHSTS